MRLYYDRTFRFVFGSDTEESREALAALLTAVLDMEDNPITKVEILNPLILSPAVKEKEIIMDIHAWTDDGVMYDIEMQTSEYGVLLDRLAYNGAKMGSNSLAKGKNYDKMKKSIVIAFVKDKVIADTDDFYTDFHICSGDGRIIMSDKFQWHVIELGKLRDDIDLETADSLELLSLFIKYAGDEEKADYVKRILAVGSNAVSKANRRLSMITEDEKRFIEEWHKELAEHDQAQRIADAEKRGLKQGLEQGIEQGIEQGLEKMIMLLKEQGQDREYIISTLKKMYGLDAVEAEKYIGR